MRWWEVVDRPGQDSFMVRPLSERLVTPNRRLRGGERTRLRALVEDT